MNRDRDVIELNKVKQARRQQDRRKKEKRGKMGRWLLFLVAIGLVLVIFIPLVRNFLLLQRQARELAEEEKRLLAEKKEISQQLKVIDDPEVIETEAREKLHLIKKGETLYVLPEYDDDKED